MILPLSCFEICWWLSGSSGLVSEPPRPSQASMHPGHWFCHPVWVVLVYKVRLLKFLFLHCLWFAWIPVSRAATGSFTTTWGEMRQFSEAWLWRYMTFLYDSHDPQQRLGLGCRASVPCYSTSVGREGRAHFFLIFPRAFKWTPVVCVCWLI